QPDGRREPELRGRRHEEDVLFADAEFRNVIVDGKPVELATDLPHRKARLVAAFRAIQNDEARDRDDPDIRIGPDDVAGAAHMNDGLSTGDDLIEGERSDARRDRLARA